MKFTFAIGAFTLTALLLIASEFNTPASADRGNDRFTIGPDVAVSRLGLSSGSSAFDDFYYYVARRHRRVLHGIDVLQRRRPARRLD